MQQNQTQTTPLNIHLASGLVRKKKTRDKTITIAMKSSR